MRNSKDVTTEVHQEDAVGILLEIPDERIVEGISKKKSEWVSDDYLSNSAVNLLMIFPEKFVKEFTEQFSNKSSKNQKKFLKKSIKVFKGNPEHIFK